MDLSHSVGERRWLGRYEMMGEIACGGMARVYLARLGGVGGFQRLYAVKRLHEHLAAERELVRMFLDEARVAACLHHPSVVPILEVGESDGTYFLVMPYVEGDSVAGLMAALGGYAPERRGGPIAIPTAVRIVLDALAGLHAAHELVDPTGVPIGLVHRDCSPQNVLVGVDGCARIIDFGVARASARLTRTRSGLLKGKLAYMAPEQVRGDKDLDRRCDVFAMGIVLWELLAGRRLFKLDSELATLAAVVEQPVPMLRAVAPHVPAPLENVCMRALERDRARRFASAAEMATALERAAHAAYSGSGRAIASNRDVADFVAQVAGAELATRRAAVRAWLSRPAVPSSRASSASDATRRLAALDDLIEGTPTRPVALPSVMPAAAEGTSSTAPMVLVRKKPTRPLPRFLIAGAAAVALLAAVGVAVAIRSPPLRAAEQVARLAAAPSSPSAHAAPPSATAAFVAPLPPVPAMSVSDLADATDTSVSLSRARRASSFDARRSAPASRAAPPVPAPAVRVARARPIAAEPASADLVNPYR